MPKAERYRMRHEKDTVPRPEARHMSFRHILACVDWSPVAGIIVAHAAALAEIMGGRLSVVRVIEPANALKVPVDPIQWEISRSDAEAEVATLAAGTGHCVEVETTVLHGPAAETIVRWAGENDVDLTVLGSQGASGESGWALSGTARRIAASVSGSVLIVPVSGTSDCPQVVRYRRLMVPLDCSARAEAALPIATQIASSHQADVILAHAVPGIAFTMAGPPEPEDTELRERVRHRNERVARQYLDRVRARLPMDNKPARIRLFAGGDPRHTLARALAEHSVDIVVLSSSGLGGHSDMPFGSTAEFMIGHSPVPVLLVRCESALPNASRHPAGDAPSARSPGRLHS